MSSDEISARALAIFRDPIWQSVGVFVAILIALTPTFRSLATQFSATAIRRFFWSTAVPLLAAFAIIAAVWRQVEIVIALNILLVTIYWMKQRGVRGQESITELRLPEKPKEIPRPADNTSRAIIKPPKR